MSLLDWLSKNYPFLTALAAVGTVLVNVYLAILKRRADSAEETAKRVDAAAKIVKTSTDLLTPFEKRVAALEQDNEKFIALIDTQGGQIKSLQAENELLRYELRAIKADRNNLLQRVLILQEENERLKGLVGKLQSDFDSQADENARLKTRIAQLESELEKLRPCEDIGDRDTEERTE